MVDFLNNNYRVIENGLSLIQNRIIKEQIGKGSDRHLYRFITYIIDSEELAGGVYRGVVSPPLAKRPAERDYGVSEIKRVAIRTNILEIAIRKGVITQDKGRNIGILYTSILDNLENFVDLGSDFILLLSQKLLKSELGAQILTANLEKFISQGPDFSLQLLDNILKSDFGPQILRYNLEKFLPSGPDFSLQSVGDFLEPDFGPRILTANLERSLPLGQNSTLILLDKILESKFPMPILANNLEKFISQGPDFSLQLLDKLLESEIGAQILISNLEKFISQGPDFSLQLLDKLLESEIGAQILRDNLEKFLNSDPQYILKLAKKLLKSDNGMELLANNFEIFLNSDPHCMLELADMCFELDDGDTMLDKNFDKFLALGPDFSFQLAVNLLELHSDSPFVLIILLENLNKLVGLDQGYRIKLANSIFGFGDYFDYFDYDSINKQISKQLFNSDLPYMLRLISELVKSKLGFNILNDNLEKFLVLEPGFSTQLVEELLKTLNGAKAIEYCLEKFISQGPDFSLQLVDKLLLSNHGIRILAQNLEKFRLFMSVDQKIALIEKLSQTIRESRIVIDNWRSFEGVSEDIRSNIVRLLEKLSNLQITPKGSVYSVENIRFENYNLPVIYNDRDETVVLTLSDQLKFKKQIIQQVRYEATSLTPITISGSSFHLDENEGRNILLEFKIFIPDQIPSEVWLNNSQIDTTKKSNT